MTWASRATTFLGALALLHFVAAAPIPLRAEDLLRGLAAVSPDLVALVALAVLGATLSRPRLFGHLAALLLLIATGFRAVCVNVEIQLERPFELTDFKMWRGVLHLCLDDKPEWEQWVLMGGAVLGACVAQVVLAWAFVRLARCAHRQAGALSWALALQAVVLLALAQSGLGEEQRSLCHPSALRILAGKTLRFVEIQIDPAAIDDPIRADIAASMELMAKAPSRLEKLAGADVHLLVIESYGRVALRHPALAPHFQPLWRELEADLQAAGFHAAIGACKPSISGGESWLSHAELFSSVRVPNQRTWELLLESDLVPLPRRFREAGYHTVEVMPAMDRHWPEGAKFYGFEESVTRLELDYQGTVYHWGRMPDQFALHHLLERVVKPAQQPLFATYISVTSHVPWKLVPPYVADWRIGPETFKVPPRVVHPCSLMDVPRDPRLVAAYRDALDYSLRAAVGYVCRLPRPSLVILLGDHQPPIASSLRPPDHEKDVPVHVFANRPELLEPCLRSGFVAGTDLPASVVANQLADFAYALLRLYAQ